MSQVDDERTRSMALSSGVRAGARVIVFWDGGTISRGVEPGLPLTLGRGEDCDIQILHPSVSRRHARIDPGPPLTVEDLGSSNGTRVDGELVNNARRVLGSGQVVEIGAAVVVVQVTSLNLKGEPAAKKPQPPDLERFVALVAKSQLPVLILGETGAGKEAMAERIHSTSTRSAGPFVKLNCAAFPEALLESELFGHEKGAFTGATHAKAGLIESAEGGTLLLDEIGEMPAGAQAAVLRVLESHEVRRVGALRPFPVNVRLLSATNRDLEALVAEGGFRQDLFYRLNGVSIVVPPLRERRQEILELARVLLARAAAQAGVPAPSFTRSAEATLLRHPWPGNVRELRNVIQRALVFCEGQPIDGHHLLLGDSVEVSDTSSLGDQLNAYEKEQILQALTSTDGNQTRAAALLGMSRRALINRLDAYGLPRPRKRTAE